MDYKEEYKLLLKRFRHLLESDYIALYDEVDPITKQYKRNIKEFDKLINANIDANKELHNYSNKIITHKYFLYFKRVYFGRTVGQGTRQIELDEPITDIQQLNDIAYKLDKEIKNDSNTEVALSTALIVNFVKLE